MALKLYRVGTLAYTRGALIQVMFWLLWGDFFFQLMESLPSLTPLLLRWQGATDSTIGLVNFLPPFLGFFLFPIAGVQSDRYRGPLGRRRPFLLWCTGPVVIGLVLMGAAKPAGELLAQVLGLLGSSGITVAGCTIAWITMCVVIFVIFNAYIVQVFSCLVIDVVPLEVLGTYFGLYRAVGALGSLAFSRWAFRWAEFHTFHVYFLIAVLYAAAFMMIVWRVKEGTYPPPAPKEPSNSGWRMIQLYFRECFSERVHVCYYLINFFTWGSGVPLGFLVFYATQAGQPDYAPTLGLPLQQFGEVKSWTFVITIPIFIFSGPLIDRFKPMPVTLVGLLLTSVSYFSGFWLVRGALSLQIWWCVNQCALSLYLVAICAVAPLVLPRAKFGQFVSANVAFGFLSLMFMHPLVGRILQSIRDYRYIFILCGVLTALATVACYLLSREWHRLLQAQKLDPNGTGAPAQ